MNVGLVDPTEICNDTGRPVMPLGLLHLAAVAENIGHEVRILPHVYKGNQTLGELENLLKEYVYSQNPRILGFSNRTESLPLVLDLAKKCKSWNKDMLVILGGAGTNFVAKNILELFPFVDLIVCGEGEVAFREVILAVDSNQNFHNIAGICWRDNKNNIIVNSPRLPISDLDSLPEPAFHLIEEALVTIGQLGKRMFIEVGRGCPNNCSFCSAIAFWGRKVRMFSPARIIGQMELLRERYGICSYCLIHDNLLSNHAFIKKFCQLVFERDLHIDWFANVSLNFCTEEIIRMAAEAGCTEIFFGVETVSDALKPNIHTKYRGPSNVVKVMDIVRKHGIKKIYRSYIYGFPGETDDDINSTLELELLEKAKSPADSPERSQFSLLTVYPGTSLYAQLSEKLRYTTILSSFGCRYISANNSFMNLVKKHPTIFTSFASHQSEEERLKIIERISISWLLTMIFPRTTLLAMRRCHLTPTEVMKKFKEFLLTNSWFKVADDNKGQNIFVRCYSLYPEFILKELKGIDASEIDLFLGYEKYRVEATDEELKYRDFYPSLNKSAMQHELVTPPTTNFLSLNYDPDATFSQWIKNTDDAVKSCGRDTSYCFYAPRTLWVTLEFNPEIHVWRLGKNVSIVKNVLDCARSGMKGEDIVENTYNFLKTANMENKYHDKKGIENYTKLMLATGLIVFRDEIGQTVGACSQLDSCHPE